MSSMFHEWGWRWSNVTPQVWSEESISLRDGFEGGLDEVTHGSGLTTVLRRRRVEQELRKKKSKVRT
jgi:hypothetical protein